MKHSLLLFFFLPFFQLIRGQTSVYLNPQAAVEERVNDLISRMSLSEKVSQMVNHSPAIKHLHVPANDWWNEALHGVARNGLATSFPQAIGLSATWNKQLMFAVATVISDEARAKYNMASTEGHVGRYQGLTFWSPNINIFRDPRWGRGQETYGEDPFLTGRMAVQFIRGMQGDNPKYYKVIATAKHFAVHSGPESERHKFDATVSEYDLRETYLPAFKSCVTDGKVASLMCAYNSLNGEACCGNNRVLNDILRNEWGFKGYVVSDCGAISDIYGGHRQEPDAVRASARAAKAGTDLECGETYRHLVAACKKGKISDARIDTCVKRLFTARMKLGMFDPPSMIPWSNLGKADVDTKENKQLALQAARESIVLLKNSGNILPLKKNITSIAVIGPDANDAEILLGNYNGAPSHTYTPLEGIRNAASATTKVYFEQGCAQAGKSSTDKEMENRAIEIAKKSDVVIMCMRLTPRVEGEEMPVQTEGFSKGDRTTIDLPQEQEALIKKIAALQKPVILVLVNGGALSINWENENLSAIIESWYGGQAAGEAIADVLFGDYNPSGRLPVTFYKSVSQLPAFDNYSMKGRTYRYFDGPVIYPFGYGLSYTSFAITNPRVSGVGGGTKAIVDVKNTGNREGAEVVELYVKGGNGDTAIKSLRGFEKIFLKPGETKTVEFAVTPETLAFYLEGVGYVVPNGEHTLLMGASSAESDLKEVKIRME